MAPLLRRPFPTAQSVSRLPVARRDFSVWVDEALPAAAVVAALEAAKLPKVTAIRIFDVYRGAGLTDGKKSLAILVLMQDTERTLTDAEIDATIAALVQITTERFGASLRSQVLQ